jgi:hypothetical protein
MGVFMTKKKPITAKVNDDIHSALVKEAEKNKITKSKQVNRIITEHFTKGHQQSFEEIWRTQPKRLYCPMYGWSNFPEILTECQSCQYRTAHFKTKCPMWYKRTGTYSPYNDPPQKIKHRR